MTEDNFDCLGASWFPDGKRVLLLGREPEQEVRAYVLELATGERKALASERTVRSSARFPTRPLVSPEGARVVMPGENGEALLISVHDGEARSVPGVAASEIPIQWSADGHSLYVRRDLVEAGRTEVYRVDLASGRREIWHEFLLDPARISGNTPIVLTPDGRYYAYTFVRHMSELYLVTGLD